MGLISFLNLLVSSLGHHHRTENQAALFISVSPFEMIYDSGHCGSSSPAGDHMKLKRTFLQLPLGQTQNLPSRMLGFPSIPRLGHAARTFPALLAVCSAVGSDDATVRELDGSLTGSLWKNVFPILPIPLLRLLMFSGSADVFFPSI